MQANNKTYGFTMTIHEYHKTIPTLWQNVQQVRIYLINPEHAFDQSVGYQFFREHPEYIHKDNSLNFLVDDMSKGLDAGYNRKIICLKTED
jgi:alpha 1,2-mannosyltransferase